LTTEDISTLEPREKVELFRSYYFVSLRSFEQDPASASYLSPLSLYMIVFRNGILTFHTTPTPHPANVRRRIRQLKDYIQVSADWICYALIDDIVDGFAPLLEGVEQQVDAIDEGVLQLHKDQEEVGSGEMLQRIGLTRKKVMGLLRLLGSKADVIKGFSKRCNEKWEIAPRSEIGLYLGDIQGTSYKLGVLMFRSYCDDGSEFKSL
jgi:magnesium transporter